MFYSYSTRRHVSAMCNDTLVTVSKGSLGYTITEGNPAIDTRAVTYFMTFDEYNALVEAVTELNEIEV